MSGEDLELGATRGRATVTLGRTQVEDSAAANGARGGGVAKHEAVTRSHGRRPVEHNLRVVAIAGRDAGGLEREHAGVALGRAVMELHGQPLRERLALAGQQLERHVDAVRRTVQRRLEQDLAARHALGIDLGAGKRERTALAREAESGGRILRMNRAHARLDAAGRGQHPIANGNAAREDRSRDDRARAAQREAAVDGEAEAAISGP